MSNYNNSIAFGFDRSKAKAYHLDNYSTPDNWFHMGYEIEYTFNIKFQEEKEWADKREFLGEILKIFDNNFGPMDGDHYKLDVPPDNIGEYLIKVFWDKGSFNLNILNSLENEVNKIAILNHTTVELIALIIIPRSREKLVLKIQGKL